MLNLLNSNIRVIFVDDQYSEIENLIKWFSKISVPSIYYSSDVDELPVSVDINSTFWIIFMDIYLDWFEWDMKTSISRITSTLKRLVNEDTPYILVFWTAHPEDIKEVYEWIISTDKTLTPVEYLWLSKEEYSDWNIEKLMSDIESKVLPTRFKIILIKNYYFNISSNQLLTELVNKFWKAKIPSLIRSISKSYWWELSLESDDSIIKSSIKWLSDIYLDYLESNINDTWALFNLQNILVDADEDIISKQDKQLLNTKILSSNIDSLMPWYTLTVDLEKLPEKSLVKEYFESMHKSDFKDFTNLIFNWIAKKYWQLEQYYTKEVEAQKSDKTKRQQDCYEQISSKISFNPIMSVVSPYCNHIQWTTIPWVWSVVLWLSISIENSDPFDAHIIDLLPKIIRSYKKWWVHTQETLIWCNGSLKGFIRDKRSVTLASKIHEMWNFEMKLRKHYVNDLQHSISSYISRPWVSIIDHKN